MINFLLYFEQLPENIFLIYIYYLENLILTLMIYNRIGNRHGKHLFSKRTTTTQ